MQTVVDLISFRYIVSKLQDLSTVLDTEISISLDLSEINTVASSCGFTLSLPLKNGRVDVDLTNGTGSLNYFIDYADDEDEAEKIEFSYEGNLKDNFDTALRAAILADKAASN